MAIPSNTEGVRLTTFVSINGVDVSAYVRSASFPSERPEEEYAASGQGDDAEFDLGRAARMLNLTLLQNFYSGTVFDTLKALHAAANGQEVIYGPKGSGTGERKFTFTGKLPTFNQDEFEYNSLSTIDVAIRASGAVTEATF